MTSPAWKPPDKRAAPCDFAQVPNVAVVKLGHLTPISRSDKTTRPEQSIPDGFVPPKTYRTPRYLSAAWTRRPTSPLRKAPATLPIPVPTPPAKAPAAVPTPLTDRTPEIEDS